MRMIKDLTTIPDRHRLLLMAASLLLCMLACATGCDVFSGAESAQQSLKSPGLTADNSQSHREAKANPTPDPVAAKLLPVTNEEENRRLHEKWGIRVESLMLTSAGHMLDFRYRVTDPDKAMPLFDPAAKPYLVDQATGRKCIVPKPPKVGSLRQVTRKPEAGRIYCMIFANPARTINRGSHVTVVIGDFKAQNLTVQ